MRVSVKQNNEIVFKNTEEIISGIKNGFVVIDNRRYNFSIVSGQIFIVKDMIKKDSEHIYSSKDFIVFDENDFLNSKNIDESIISIKAINFPINLLDGNAIIEFINNSINNARSQGVYNQAFENDMQAIIEIIHDFNGEDYELFEDIVLKNKTLEYDDRMINIIKNILNSMFEQNHNFKIKNPTINEYVLALKVAFGQININARDLSEENKDSLKEEVMINEPLIVENVYDSINGVNEEIEGIEDVGFVSQMFDREETPVGPKVNKEASMPEYNQTIMPNESINDSDIAEEEKYEKIVEEKTIENIKPECRDIEIDENKLFDIVENNEELNPALQDEQIISNLEESEIKETELVLETNPKDIIEKAPDIELFPEETIEDTFIEKDILTPDEIYAQSVSDAEEVFNKDKAENAENRKECLQSSKSEEEGREENREEYGNIEGNNIEQIDDFFGPDIEPEYI